MKSFGVGTVAYIEIPATSESYFKLARELRSAAPSATEESLTNALERSFDLNIFLWIAYLLLT